MGSGPVQEPIMQFLMCISYLRYGLVGFTTSIYGSQRSELSCSDEIYCHYKEPELLIRDLGMEGDTFKTQLFGLCVCIFVFRGLAYLFLRYRLTAEFSNRILNYVSKVLRHK